MWTYLLILLAVALVATLVGYKNYIWFLSVGYGLAVAALGAALLILFAPALKLVTVLACIVFIAYGCRLAGFLLYRELKSKSYKKGMEGEVAKTVPIFVMIF
ncbi:MAG: steroid reductase, partial [Oscillospiraceae bacterium]|nr:steroid reductase [Oscillospiraceae bacterium]